MNKGFKPILFTALVAVFGTANAQHAPAAPAAPSASAPAAVTPAPATPATPAAPSAPAPAVAAPAPASTHATPAAPSAPAPAVIAPAPAHATPPAPAHATPSAPAVAAPASEAPTQPTAEPVAQAPEETFVTQATTAQPDSAIILIVEHPKQKKKRGLRPNKSDLTLVDVPANFEIQARKVMPIDSDGWGNDNLDTWWGRANLAVETRSDYFEGRIHLRMYPGQFYGNPVYVKDKDETKLENRDILQVYEAWAWHRGDYVNLKIGRWDNTTRYGSKTFGGYIDAKKNWDVHESRGTGAGGKIKSGFMSTLDPENILQFGLNNFSENVSLDIALISSDDHLNKGDLRVYFAFKGLEGLKPLNIGIGYRSNIFDEIYSKYGDVTHTVDVGASVNLLSDVGIIKNLNLFGEFAFIGLDDQAGKRVGDDVDPDYMEKCTVYFRCDKEGIKKGDKAPLLTPFVGGFEFDLYQGFDKLVIEAEYNGDRKNLIDGSDNKVRDIQGSIYVQKKLNDRFTLNMGMQSENNTKDFSFAGRLQGKIN